MVVTVGWSTIVHSTSSGPSTHASHGTGLIQDYRLQLSSANERQARFVPSAGSATTLPATVPWPACISSSSQGCPLPPIRPHSISLLGAQRQCCISVWHGTKESALGQLACIVTFVQHAKHQTGPETVQILQRILSTNQLSPGFDLVSPITYLPADDNAQ